MTPELSLRDLCAWATQQAERLRQGLSAEAAGHPPEPRRGQVLLAERAPDVDLLLEGGGRVAQYDVADELRFGAQPLDDRGLPGGVAVDSQLARTERRPGDGRVHIL